MGDIVSLKRGLHHFDFEKRSFATKFLQINRGEVATSPQYVFLHYPCHMSIYLCYMPTYYIYIYNYMYICITLLHVYHIFIMCYIGWCSYVPVFCHFTSCPWCLHQLLALCAHRSKMGIHAAISSGWRSSSARLQSHELFCVCQVDPGIDPSKKSKKNGCFQK